ncbi:MAG: hypothetical protein HQL93_05760 [Magnetococcales bacterium]|nr:hypothetical protein [Magnetococcales bacterium]
MHLELLELMKSLRLKGMANAMERELTTAEQEGLPVAKVLQRLLQEEHRYRQEQSLAYRLHQAKLPWEWSIETFPFKRQTGVNPSQIRALPEKST